MTRKEAIKWIERERDYVAEQLATILVDALNMAIAALRQPEIVRCKDCEFYCEDKGCEMHDILSDPDDFCSYAAKR